MSKFIKIVKKNLQKGQHYSLMDAFKTRLSETEFTNGRLTVLIETFHERFEKENFWFAYSKASEVIARRRAADKRRDKFYSKLYALVRVWYESEEPAMEQAATALRKVFKQYRLNVADQLDAETGGLEIIIEVLSTAEMQAHIETLGGKWLFDEMKASHELFKELRMEQSEEESRKVTGALVKARKACDAAYDDIIRTIEAAAIVADDPAPYEAFIKSWNGMLMAYRDILNRKKNRASKDSATGDQGLNADSESE